jgi:hypothetical protein
MTTETKTDGLSRPKSAYILFCGANRPKIKAENDGINPKKMLELLGQAWKVAKENGQDQEFVKLAEAEKLKYQTAKDNAKKNNEDIPVAPKKNSKKAKAVSDKSDKKAEVSTSVSEKKPKKLNGYIKYLQANREGCKKQNPDYSSKQVTKALADGWNGLSDGVKLEWKNKE